MQRRASCLLLLEKTLEGEGVDRWSNGEESGIQPTGDAAWVTKCHGREGRKCAAHSALLSRKTEFLK